MDDDQSFGAEAEGWTTGFFPGQLWLLYQATGSPQWLAAAQQWTAPLASQASAPRVDPRTSASS